MELGDINYKALRRIQQLEKNSPLLTKIDTLFYSRLSAYLKTLDTIAKKEENAQKSKFLQEEIQNTKKIATSIYEQREKKIVQAALSTARGGKPDLKNLLEGEKILFDSIVAQIMQTRKKIFDTKPEEKKKETPPIKPENRGKQENTNPMVRVTADIPEFVGTDMKNYRLRKEDVVSLPKDMADPLVKRGVAKPVK